jgi:hypothetical protein
MPLDVHESLVSHGIIPGKEIGPKEPQALCAMPGDQRIDLLEKLPTFHGKTVSVERLAGNPAIFHSIKSKFHRNI